MSTIDILLATFNGANFIENQILSLISQDYKDWRLTIHDDGSSDDTVVIIKKYIDFDHRIKILDDGIRFGNAGQNFMHLLGQSSADFIIFCDQDDIWFESKLSILFAKLKDEVEPALVYSGAFTYHNGKITGNRIHFFNRTKLEDSLFLNSGIQGCSVMFNRKLLNSFKLPAVIYMHDHTITLAAVTFGKIIKVDLPLMLYRQHQKNVTGNMKVNFFDRLKLFLFNPLPVIDRGHYDATNSFFYKNKDRLNQRSTKLFKAYLSFPTVSLLHRMLIVLRYQFSVGSNPISLLLKTLLRKAL